MKPVYVYMYDGKRVDLRNPKTYMKYVYPIGKLLYSLSRVPRWQGWSSRNLFDHSSEVFCEIKKPWTLPRAWLCAMLHDSAEVFTGDIPRQVKRLSPGIRALENEILRNICRKYKVSFANIINVKLKEADERAFRKELKDVKKVLRSGVQSRE